MQRSQLSSSPASCQLVEELLVKLLVALLAPHGEEDVATDELMDDLAVSREALEDDVLVILKLDHHVPRLPVDVPSLHSGVSPRLDVVTIHKAHPHYLVVSNTLKRKKKLNEQLLAKQCVVGRVQLLPTP